MSMKVYCKSCNDLVSILASKRLDDFHILQLLECGHWIISHEPGKKYYDPTSERDYCFEIKKNPDNESSYWRCHCGNHCWACDGKKKTFCCPCYSKKNPSFTQDQWCPFCQFWYGDSNSNKGEIKETKIK